MATEYELDDFDDYDDNAISQVRKAHRAAQKRIKELETELTSFRSESRKRSVQDVLTSRGFNAKIADLIPGDLTNPEEISAWLDDRADLFQPSRMEASSEDRVDEQDAINAGVQPPEGYHAFNDAVNQGAPVAGDESQVLAMIQAAKTPEELNKILFNGANGPAVY
jgi:hypothetical protein